MADFTITLNANTTANAIVCVENQLQTLGGTTEYDGGNTIEATGVDWGTDQKSLNNLMGKLNNDCSKVNNKKPPVKKVVEA
ncbi:MAG TPA: hypothetical protein VII75_12765 [Thermoanaerobaculia bacterium]